MSRLSTRLLSQVGAAAILGARGFFAIITFRFNADAFFRAMLNFGERSVGVVAATAAFTGMIMVLQAATYVRQFGVYNLVGWYTGFATLREVGPVLVGLMFSGRVGASNTSELATMAVTEQIDAMRILALSPTRFLIAPRLLAMVVSMAGLILFADVIAILAGAILADGLLGVEPALFFNSLLSRLSIGDLYLGFNKALFFGAIIGVLSTYFGLSAKRGSLGVGTAVTAQVTASAFCLFAADFIIGLMGAALNEL